MQKHHSLLLVMSFSLASGALMASVFNNALVSGQDDAKRKTVSAEALCRGDYEIIGLLGKSYGQISQVRAVWDRERGDTPKPPGLVFRITHVDGKELAKEKQIEVSDRFVRNWSEPRGDKPHEPGDVFEGRVYESGGYVRPPAKVREILRGSTPVVADAFGFQFYSFVYCIDEETFQRLRAAEGSREASSPKAVESGRARER